MLAHGKTRSWTVAAALATVGVISTVTAGNPVEWVSPTGGDWHVPANWNPASVPISTTDVNFGLAGTYQIDFSANAQARDLTVSTGEINFALGTNRLQTNRFILNGGIVTLPSLVHGTAAAGQVGSTNVAELRAGQLNVPGGSFLPGQTSHVIDLGTGTTTTRSGLSVNATSGETLSVRLQAGAAADLPWGQSILVGHSGSKGHITVTGVGSHLNSSLSNGTTGAGGGLYVGITGAVGDEGLQPSVGVVRVEDGATLTSRGTTQIGFRGGHGRLEVDNGVVTLGLLQAGAGTYTADGRFRAATGEIDVAGGGRLTLSVTSSGAFIGDGATGLLRVRGTGSRLVTPRARVGTGAIATGDGYVAGNGRVEITDGGVMEVQHSAGGAIFIGGTSGHGEMLISGAGSRLEADVIMQIGTGSTSGVDPLPSSGTMKVVDGGAVDATWSRLNIAPFGGAGDLSIGHPDGTDVSQPVVRLFDLTLGLEPRAHPGRNAVVNINPAGRLIVADAVSANHATQFLSVPSQLNLLGGHLQASSLQLSEASQFNWTAGTLHLTGGVSEIPAIAVPSAGLLRGKGTIAGDLAINAGGKLGIELRSNSNFDAFVITGTQTTIGGDLELTLAGSFVPAASDAFTILSGTSIVSGAFANESFGLIPLAGGGGGFEVAYAASSIVLSNFLRTGDVNDDGAVNNLDIAAFVGLLTGGGASGRSLFAGDVNGDGAVNNLDIAPFVALLTGGRPIEGNDPVFAPLIGLVPEPASLGLLALLAPLAGRRRAPR